MGDAPERLEESISVAGGRFALVTPAGTEPAPDMLDRLVAAAEAEKETAIGVWEALCPAMPPRLYFDPVDGRGARHAGGPRLVRRPPGDGAAVRLIPDARFAAGLRYSPMESPLRLASVGPGFRGVAGRLRAALSAVAPVDAVLAGAPLVSGCPPRAGSPPLAAIVRASPGREAGLRRAMASLGRQTWPVAEIVIVADGTVDVELAVRGSGVDPARVRTTQGPRRGPAAAGNTGLDFVRSPRVFFLDDDDAVWPWHAETLAGALDARPDCAWAAAWALEVSVGAIGGPGYALRGRLDNVEALRIRNPFAIQSVTFRVEAARAAGGFDPALEALEDWDLWLRLAARTPLATLSMVTSEFGVPGARAKRRARATVHARHFADVAARAQRLAFEPIKRIE